MVLVAQRRVGEHFRKRVARAVVPGLTVDDVRAVTGAAVHDGRDAYRRGRGEAHGQPRQIYTGYTERDYP